MIIDVEKDLSQSTFLKLDTVLLTCRPQVTIRFDEGGGKIQFMGVEASDVRITVILLVYY